MSRELANHVPVMPLLPPSGGFLEAIRQSSRELRISSKILVILSTIRRFNALILGLYRFHLKISRDCFFLLHSQHLLDASRTKMV